MNLIMNLTKAVVGAHYAKLKREDLDHIDGRRKPTHILGDIWIIRNKRVSGLSTSAPLHSLVG